MIEECGAVVVDDDLYTGFRYISTDVPEDGDPLEALARLVLRPQRHRPVRDPRAERRGLGRLPARVARGERRGGVIVLMAKFCEPHMLYYPELRKALDRSQVPHLLIETEHEGLPLETVRTRVEAFLERIRRGAKPALATA